MVWFCIAHMCARCRIRVLFQGGRREVLVSVKRANTGKAAPADRKSHVSCVCGSLPAFTSHKFQEL